MAVRPSSPSHSGTLSKFLSSFTPRYLKMSFVIWLIFILLLSTVNIKENLVSAEQQHPQHPNSHGKSSLEKSDQLLERTCSSDLECRSWNGNATCSKRSGVCMCRSGLELNPHYLPNYDREKDGVTKGRGGTGANLTILEGRRSLCLHPLDIMEMSRAVSAAEPFNGDHMLIVMIVLGIMFAGMCVALNLFSRARFRNSRSVFSTNAPRLITAHKSGSTTGTGIGSGQAAMATVSGLSMGVIMGGATATNERAGGPGLIPPTNRLPSLKPTPEEFRRTERHSSSSGNLGVPPHYPSNSSSPRPAHTYQYMTTTKSAATLTTPSPSPTPSSSTHNYDPMLVTATMTTAQHSYRTKRSRSPPTSSSNNNLANAKNEFTDLGRVIVTTST